MKVEVDIPKEEDQIVEDIRNRYGFKTKNQALNFIIKNFLGQMKEQEQIGVGFTDISPLEKKYVNQVLDSERLSYGPFLKKFEEKSKKVWPYLDKDTVKFKAYGYHWENIMGLIEKGVSTLRNMV